MRFTIKLLPFLILAITPIHNVSAQFEISGTTRFVSLVVDGTSELFPDSRVRVSSEFELIDGEVALLLDTYSTENIIARYQLKFEGSDNWIARQPNDKRVNYVLGPVKVRLISGSASKFVSAAGQIIIYRTEGSSITAQTTSKGEIVVPTGLKGEITVALEQSTDLANWTEVPSGNYSAQESDLYFRLKATHLSPQNQ